MMDVLSIGSKLVIGDPLECRHNCTKYNTQMQNDETTEERGREEVSHLHRDAEARIPQLHKASRCGRDERIHRGSHLHLRQQTQPWIHVQHPRLPQRRKTMSEPRKQREREGRTSCLARRSSAWMCPFLVA